MTREFYEAEPSPRTSWRLAVLMGANSRTYKFALASALLEFAAEGRAEVTVDELAVPYAMSLAPVSKMHLRRPPAPWRATRTS
ncbi:hypothetical protein ACH4MU_29665 [Streptomyces albidoflavus]